MKVNYYQIPTRSTSTSPSASAPTGRETSDVVLLDYDEAGKLGRHRHRRSGEVELERLVPSTMSPSVERLAI